MKGWMQILSGVFLLLIGSANAQTQSNVCPTFPAASGLSWQVTQPPQMLFCRALRSDGSEAFAVTLSRDNPFKTRRSKRREESLIDGRQVRWYESEIAGVNTIARETLIEYDNGVKMHISLQAQTPDQLAQVYAQLQDLRYNPGNFSP